MLSTDGAHWNIIHNTAIMYYFLWSCDLNYLSHLSLGYLKSFRLYECHLLTTLAQKYGINE